MQEELSGYSYDIIIVINVFDESLMLARLEIIITFSYRTIIKDL
jgi:hypothetical protein